MHRGMPLCLIPLHQHPLNEGTAAACAGDVVRCLLFVLLLPTGSGPSPAVRILVRTAFPSADSPAPSDSSSGPWHGVGVSLASCPRALTSLTKSPVFDGEDANGMVAVACCWRPPPCSTAPQSPDRGGQVDRYGHDHEAHGAGPSSGVAPTISRVTGWHLRQGLPGAPFPVGRGTLQGMPPVMPQPHTPSWRLVSSSGCLSGACCSSRRVVCQA